MTTLLRTLLIACITSLSVIQAHAQEDSCVANMQVTPDHNDPMTIHFCFDGIVPQGAFQFAGVWDFGDGNQSTDSCPVHTYAQPGNYLVCLSFSICIPWGLSCSDDTCVNVSVANLSDMNELNQTSSFFTYPNPAGSQFFIRANSNKVHDLIIADPSGKVICRTRTLSDAPVDVSGLSNGIYFIELRDDDVFLKRKLVIQR